LHGGSTPAGIASPHFRHGKRSRYFRHLPKEIGEHYQAALHDEQLVSLREQLALLEARMLEVAGKLKETKIPPWEEALAALEKLLQAEKGEDTENALADLQRLMREGVDAGRFQQFVWREIRELVQEKTKTAAAEWKRLSELQGLVTVEQALSFAKAFFVAAKNIGLDPELLKQLERETIHLLPPPED